MVRDLTPEREWETALRMSRERFQRFFANAPVGIALIDSIWTSSRRQIGPLANCSGPGRKILSRTLIGFVTTRIGARLR